jgi:hypothetical protein
MNSLQLADAVADPVQVLGMSFYFDPFTRARGKESGLNSFEYYGLGRGGTLGDVDVAAVVDAFTFFHPRALDRMWTQAKEKADPVAVAVDYVEAAYGFADRTFGALDVQVLRDFAAAAHKVAASVESGHHHLVDGYKQYEVPTNPVHAAYLGCILLRELRGCVHIDAVNETGLSALEACYLQDPAFLHQSRLPRRRDTERDARERRPEAARRGADVGDDGRVLQCVERRRAPESGRRCDRDVRRVERSRSSRLSVDTTP